MGVAPDLRWRHSFAGDAHAPKKLKGNVHTPKKRRGQTAHLSSVILDSGSAEALGRDLGENPELAEENLRLPEGIPAIAAAGITQLASRHQ